MGHSGGLYNSSMTKGRFCPEKLRTLRLGVVGQECSGESVECSLLISSKSADMGIISEFYLRTLRKIKSDISFGFTTIGCWRY